MGRLLAVQDHDADRDTRRTGHPPMNTACRDAYDPLLLGRDGN
jgi:hypothetical protein